MHSLFCTFVGQFEKTSFMNSFMLLVLLAPWHIILIIAVILLLFGGKKIPELMKGIGEGAREFKKGLAGEDEEQKKKDEADKK